MIANFGIGLISRFIALMPVIALPDGISAAFNLLSNLIGYINIFVPVAALAPVLALIILVRNWNIVMAVIRLVLRFIPFLG